MAASQTEHANMTTTTVCLLHPGEMGAEVGAAARAGGARVLWVSAGRGGATRDRAGAAGLEDVGALSAALAQAQIVLSVCPPHAAVELAESVAAAGFRGIYLDANAIAPETSRRIGRIVEAKGASFVDGGIIGPPPTKPGTTRLYVSGTASAEIAALFSGSSLGTVTLDAPVGAASAIKACYAGWTKGAATLLLSVRALARHEGIETALADEWKISQPQLFAQLDRAVLQSRKGWRWIAEMEEIGATFREAGLPDGYALGAAEACRRLVAFKDTRGLTIEDVVQALLAPTKS
jgi:3-hydroxyisobutyrate dehydrogenase-like beta-hydroxyacid dehydrogenase